MIDLRQGDCLELMKNIPDKSVDMILCDLPYGVTRCKWDIVIPFEPLWEQYDRIVKDNGAIILFGSGMFTAEIMYSNRKMWRYNLVWDKVAKTGFLNANIMPLRQHEDIVVFYKKAPTYNPQMIKCKPHKRNHRSKNTAANNCYGSFLGVATVVSDEKYPASIVRASKEHHVGNFYHPTQKPIALIEWLIKTYTNKNEIVLDNCMGSGSTGVACVNTARNFIGIELNEHYFDVAKKRIEEAMKQ